MLMLLQRLGSSQIGKDEMHAFIEVIMPLWCAAARAEQIAQCSGPLRGAQTLNVLPGNRLLSA